MTLEDARRLARVWVISILLAESHYVKEQGEETKRKATNAAIESMTVQQKSLMELHQESIAKKKRKRVGSTKSKCLGSD